MTAAPTWIPAVGERMGPWLGTATGGPINFWDYSPKTDIDPWIITTVNDLVPTVDDAGIGDVDQPVSHLVIGGAGISQGILAKRAAGGMGVLAVTGYDPENPSTALSAPLDLFGSVVALSSDSGVVLEVAQELTGDHYLGIGPSTVYSDGRIFCPIQVGSQVTFTSEQTATDSRAVDLNETAPLLSIVSLTTNVEYAPGSQVQLSLLLEEQGNQTALIDVVIQVGGVEVQRDTIPVTGTSQTFGLNFLTDSTIASGVLIDILAVYTQTNPNSDAWVRGDLQTSTLNMRASAAAAQQAKYYVRMPNTDYNNTVPEYLPLGAIANLIGLAWKDYGSSHHASEPGFKLIPLDSVDMLVTPQMIAQLIADGFEVLPMPLP